MVAVQVHGRRAIPQLLHVLFKAEGDTAPRYTGASSSEPQYIPTQMRTARASVLPQKKHYGKALQGVKVRLANRLRAQRLGERPGGGASGTS